MIEERKFEEESLSGTKIPKRLQNVAQPEMPFQEYFDQKFNETLKDINFSLNYQVINGPNQEVKDELKIRQLKQLKGGAQAQIFKCSIRGIPGNFIDKTRKIQNNAEMADKCLRTMFKEFAVAKDLVHPNIIEYKYFMR